MLKILRYKINEFELIKYYSVIMILCWKIKRRGKRWYLIRMEGKFLLGYFIYFLF